MCRICDNMKMTDNGVIVSVIAINQRKDAIRRSAVIVMLSFDEFSSAVKEEVCPNLTPS